MKLLAFRALCVCVLAFCLPATFAAGVQWDPDGSVHPANRLSPHFRNLSVTSNTYLSVLTVTNTITAGGLVVSAPTFSSFVNSQHNHQDAAGGGQVNASSVFSAGTIPTARLGSGVADSTTFLRGDSTWQVPAGAGSSIFFDGVSVSNPDFDSNTNVVWQINGTNVTAYVTNVTSGQILGGTGFGNIVRAGSPTISDPIFTSTLFFEGLVFTIEGAIADGNETFFEFGEPSGDATYEFDTSRMSTPGSIEVGGALISARSFHTGTSVTIPWTTDEHEIHLSADTTFSFSSVPTDTNYVSGPSIWVVGNGTAQLTNSANSILWRPTYPGVVPLGTNTIDFVMEGGVIHGYLGWRAIGTDALVVQTSAQGLTNATLVNLSLTNDTLYALPQLLDGQIPKMSATGWYTNAVEGVDYLDGNRIDDSPYDATTMNGVDDRAPSLNLFRDQIEALYALLGSSSLGTGTNQTTDNVGVPVYTNSIASGFSSRIGARAFATGSTNTYAFDIRAVARCVSGTATMVGTNNLSIIPTGGTNLLAYFLCSSSNMVFYLRGFENETVNWTWTVYVEEEYENAVDTGGPTYLFTETFEGAEAFTSGGTGTLDNSGWVATGTTVDADNSTAPVLEGTEQLDMNSGSGPRADYSTTIADDVWLYCKFRYSADGTGSTSILSVRSAGGTILLAARMNGSSAARIFVNGADGATSATTLSTGTTYHVWIHWIKAGTCEVAISTSTTRPTVDGSGDVYLTGTSANTTAGMISTATADADYRVDDIRMDDEEITP